MWTLRQMSLATAAKLAAGEDPMVEAAIVKDLGNDYEQAMPRLVQAVVDNIDIGDDSRLARLLALHHGPVAELLAARWHPRGAARDHCQRPWTEMRGLR